MNQILFKYFLIVFITSISSLYSQNFHWEVITNLNDAQEIYIKNDILYAATTGGFLNYSLSNDNYHIWNAEQGLIDHNFTTLTDTDKDLLILGSLNGTVSFHSLKSQEFYSDNSLNGNEIVSMVSVEDTLWISTTTMVAVYLFNDQLNRFQFRDFYNNFNQPFDEFRDIFYYKDKIWVASNYGLFVAPGNFLKYNLKSASSWNSLTGSDGLPANNIFSFNSISDTLLIGTANGLSKYHLQQFNNVNTGLSPKAIRHIRVKDSQIYIDNSRSIYQLDGSQFVELIKVSPEYLSDFDLTDEGVIWGAIREKGLRNYSTNQRVWFNGPIDNTLGEALLDRRGRLWIVSGGFKDERGRGFSVRLENGNWQNYRHIKNWRAAASAQAIMEDVDGNIWIGSWNGGLTIVDPELKFHHFNNYPDTGQVWVSSPNRDDTVKYSPPDSVRHFLSYTQDYPNLLVVTDIIEDETRQSIWLSLLSVQSGNPIIQYTQPAFNEQAYDSLSWQRNPIGSSIPGSPSELADLAIDIFDNLWIGTQRSGVIGMLFQEAGTLAWTQYDETDNLKSNGCLAVAADEDGYVWLGTISGLNAYLNGTLFDFREDYQPIGLNINSIFVDNENNKWFATNRGLSLLRSSGSPWDPNSWSHFVPQQSEFFGENIHHTNLPSEEVRSVFVDNNTGDVYCSTTSGLAIMRSNPFTTPLPDLNKMNLGPNPLVLEETSDNTFYIRNLTANSQVKILTSTGRLVRILDSTDRNEVLGSLAKWDGTNERGDLVSSGVYIVLVVDEEGNSNAKKFVVIRE